MTLAQLRREYHQKICTQIIRIKGKGETSYPNFADGNNRSSVTIAWNIFRQLKCDKNPESLTGQETGRQFEHLTQEFITNAFNLLQHLRPGKWLYEVGKLAISSFYQYEHLAHIEQKVNEDPILGAALGGNYIIRPDIVISRRPVSDDEINHHQTILESDTPIVRGTPLRAANHPDPDHPLPLLHASISCKWTIRSDRSQNTRTEALNLVRNRKGHTPHIVAVTAEPLPTRIASLALGTGDLDCVYHFALPELQKAIEEADNEDQLDMLKTLVDGRRLRDISDLPFDLAI